MTRAAFHSKKVEIVAINDPFIDLEYMVSQGDHLKYKALESEVNQSAISHMLVNFS